MESGFQSPQLLFQFCHLPQQYLISSHFGGKLSFQVSGMQLLRMKLIDLLILSYSEDDCTIVRSRLHSPLVER